MRFMGLDIGTSTICGVVIDASEGRVISSVTERNPGSIRGSEPWEALQAPEKIYSTVQGVMRRLLRDHSPVSGIGLTGQMHGILYLDGKGRPQSPLYTWQDGRGRQPLRGAGTYASFLSEKSAYPLSSGMGAVTHFYNIRKKLVPDGARSFCTIHDYAAMRLSGLSEPMTDSGDAASIGIFDLEKLRFDGDAISSAGMDASFFPKIVRGCVEIGKMKDGTGVYSAIGDNQASFLAASGSLRKSILLNIGTGSQVSVHLRKFIRVEGLDTRPFMDGGYLLVGAPLCGGKAYAILKKFFESTAQLFSCGPGIDYYSAMSELPFPDEISGLPIVDTRFDGSRREPSCRGAIGNLTVDNFTAENIVSAFLRGIATELFEFYSLFPESTRKRCSRLAGSGNGLRANPLQRRMAEYVFGMKLHLPDCQEEAACGAALSAAVGKGFLKNYDEAATVFGNK